MRDVERNIFFGVPDRMDAAIATSFVQSLKFGLGNLAASSICAAKNKGATPPAWLRDLAPILCSEGYICTTAIYWVFYFEKNNPDPPPPKKNKQKQQQQQQQQKKKSKQTNDRPLREFEHAVKFRRSLNNVFVSYIR